MRNRNKRRVAAAGIACALCLSMVASFAYFTDRVDASVQATAGNLYLTLSESWTSADNVSPGYNYDLTYTLTNSGNKSADVRETFIITSDVPFTGTTDADKREFEIYNGDALISTRTFGSYEKEGKTYYTITYKPAHYTLNGTGEGAEKEDGITSNFKKNEYDVIFKVNAGNEFQGANITIDYLAEAKQHRNTDDTDATWALIAKETVTFAGNAPDITNGAVPAKP